MLGINFQKIIKIHSYTIELQIVPQIRAESSIFQIIFKTSFPYFLHSQDTTQFLTFSLLRENYMHFKFINVCDLKSEKQAMVRKIYFSILARYSWKSQILKYGQNKKNEFFKPQHSWIQVIYLVHHRAEAADLAY